MIPPDQFKPKRLRPYTVAMESVYNKYLYTNKKLFILINLFISIVIMKSPWYTLLRYWQLYLQRDGRVDTLAAAYVGQRFPEGCLVVFSQQKQQPFFCYSIK